MKNTGENKTKVLELKASGKTIDEIVQITGLAKPTVYAYSRPDKPKQAKPKTVTNGTTASVGLHVTPMKNGSFTVTVPADKLAKVAAALAA